MEIAVCIPTFNQSDYVASAVESALAQTRVHTEVWVADDASTDATDKVLARFAGNPRVHLHRQMANTGIARNAGWVLSQPTNDFIVRLDSDDLLHPDYCRSLAGLLENNPQAAVAHCAVREIDARGKSGRVRRLARRSGFQKSEEALRESAAGYKVAANVCMFRRSALGSLPYIYQDGLNFAEDWDLYARLADAGWGNVYSSRVLASYRVWRDSGGVREQRRAAEIGGIKHLLADTLAEAWRKRSWPEVELRTARGEFAVAQSTALSGLAADSPEFARLRQLLADLATDDGKAIDQHLDRLRRKGRAGRLADALRVRAADLCKAVFYR
jgi:glycosyltransferase involved in cell wall biosynthesis